MVNNINEFLALLNHEQDIYSIFSELKINKQGKSYKAHCPFHQDKTPSFSISIKNNIIVYNCFGCDAQGNALTYISKIYNLDLSLADDLKYGVETLSERTGVPIPDNLFKYSKPSPEQQKFQIYHQQLKDNKELTSHLKSRGIKDLSIFGYDEEKQVYKILSKHFNSYYIIDYFPDKKPKYKFPHGFKKHIPFNQHRINKGDIWIVEGIFDALYLYENHRKNATAILGSYLHHKTINILKRYNNIILALDNDKAGKDGTVKSIHNLYSNGFSNVFYLHYNGFEHKDINDAYQKGDEEGIYNLLDYNIKSGYHLLIDEHLKNISLCKNELEKVKIREAFLNEVLSYKESIQYEIIKEYNRITGEDIKYEFNHLKSLITIDNFKSNISETINQDNFTIDSIYEIEKEVKNTVSTTLNLNIKTPKDIFTEQRPNYIKSPLINEVKYYEGAMSFIGARTSHGKTTYMINEAVNLSDSYKVAFISLEESFIWISGKLFVSWWNRKHSMITLKEFYNTANEYKNAIDDLAGNMLIIDDCMNIEDIEKHIIYLNTHMDTNIFFIDYIQRIGTKDYRLSKLIRQEQIKQINNILLNLAKRNKLYLILGTQFNRTVNKKDDIKQNTAYREAGDIEQDANLIINLWNKKDDIDNPDPNILYCYIAKNRNGKSGIEKELYIQPEYWLIEGGNQCKKTKSKF